MWGLYTHTLERLIPLHLLIWFLKRKIRREGKVNNSLCPWESSYACLERISDRAHWWHCSAIAELLVYPEIYKGRCRSFRGRLIEILGEIGDEATAQMIEGSITAFGTIDYRTDYMILFEPDSIDFSFLEMDMLIIKRSLNEIRKRTKGRILAIEQDGVEGRERMIAKAIDKINSTLEL